MSNNLCDITYVHKKGGWKFDSNDSKFDETNGLDEHLIGVSYLLNSDTQTVPIRTKCSFGALVHIFIAIRAPDHFCHFLSLHFLIIRLLKTTYPLEFLASSN